MLEMRSGSAPGALLAWGFTMLLRPACIDGRSNYRASDARRLIVEQNNRDLMHGLRASRPSLHATTSITQAMGMPTARCLGILHVFPRYLNRHMPSLEARIRRSAVEDLAPVPSTKTSK